MKKLNAETHTKALIKTNGLDIAKRIAARSLASSSPSMEAHLPNPEKGDVNIFFPKDRNGRGTKKAIRERARNHGFWSQVQGILNKMVVKKAS